MSSSLRNRLAESYHSVFFYLQGIPFFHAGDDMLRSKSLDSDSFDSGDWWVGVMT